mgnify:CR=1 FL=1|tara:strand:+ start:749 stop:1234 length:486 start_codon:yes stop_codon:yes gene_type:complete
MKEFKKKFTASWSDLDPNWHVANYSYLKYAVDARVFFFDKLNLNKKRFEELNIGPVLFYEKMYYFKEIIIGEEFYIDIRLDGYSEDGKFILYHQNFYNKEGKNLAFLDLGFGIIDTIKRKLTKMPKDSFEILKKSPKTETFRVIDKNDMRNLGRNPLNKQV